MTDHLGRPDAPASSRPDPLESALRSAFDQGEPEGPECHLCGNPAGPWLPDPTGDRWPSGAQKLFCSRGCPEHITADIAAKDTPRGASTLSSAVLDLLTAIRDALDIPLPGLDEPDERAFSRLMETRRSAVHSTLASILARPEIPFHTGQAAYIRQRTAETPITYTVRQDPDGGDE